MDADQAIEMMNHLRYQSDGLNVLIFASAWIAGALTLMVVMDVYRKGL